MGRHHRPLRCIKVDIGLATRSKKGRNYKSSSSTGRTLKHCCHHTQLGHPTHLTHALARIICSAPCLSLQSLPQTLKPSHSSAYRNWPSSHLSAAVHCKRFHRCIQTWHVLYRFSTVLTPHPETPQIAKPCWLSPADHGYASVTAGLGRILELATCMLR